MSGSINFSQRIPCDLEMSNLGNLSDMEIYLSMVESFNLTYLVSDDTNLTHIQTVLEENFLWPPDMR